MYEYKGKITKYVDGDTVDITIDVGFKMFTEQRVRLLGIDTPERWEEGYVESTNALKSMTEDETVIVRTYKSDSFGRYLAEIYVAGVNINDKMIEKGYAVKYER